MTISASGPSIGTKASSSHQAERPVSCRRRTLTAMDGSSTSSEYAPPKRPAPRALL